MKALGRLFGMVSAALAPATPEKQFLISYPSTVELTDGNLFTVCYQKVPGDKKCSLLWSRWQLPS